MADTATSDFLFHYKSISNKLKKRFLRKVNVAEPSDQFSTLAVQCEHEEMLLYAALCNLAVSRCEAVLGNPVGETWALVRAGRQFFKCHSGTEQLGIPSPGGEFLEGALNSLGQAALTSPDRFVAAALTLETAGALTEGQYQAAAILQNTATLMADQPSLQMHALSNLIAYRIEQGDLDGALSVLSEMLETVSDSPTGVHADIMLSCEISRVLALLLLRPSPRLLPASQSATLERYSWISDTADSPAWWRSEEVTTCLQSLVMGVGDAESLLGAEAALWPHLDATQRQLLRLLVRALVTASDH